MLLYLVGGERELSGVPDGKGGVLPTIKQPLSPGEAPPTAMEARKLSLGAVGVPPLVLQQTTPTHTFIRQPFSFTSNSEPRPIRQVRIDALYVIVIIVPPLVCYLEPTPQ